MSYIEERAQTAFEAAAKDMGTDMEWDELGPGTRAAWTAAAKALEPPPVDYERIPAQDRERARLLVENAGTHDVTPYLAGLVAEERWHHVASREGDEHRREAEFIRMRFHHARGAATFLLALFLGSMLAHAIRFLG